MSARLTALLAACLLLWLSSPGGAFRLLGRRWPSGSNIVMHLQLGSSGGTLIDGSPNWNTPAEHALAMWSPFLNGVEFRVVRDSTSVVALENNVNNVVWADDVYGDPFGDAIAVAISLSIRGTLIETDVLFDESLPWNSYRGNLRRAGSGGTLYDIRRVALHEFGHVLGLGHPDESGQSVAAIMNSRVGNIETLQTDDTDGVRAIYGSVSTPNRPAAATTTWTAPAQTGSVAITVTAQDSRGARATASLTLEVVPRDRLDSGASLLPGEVLVSRNRRYRLAYQHDGNLVLYDDVAQTVLFATHTGGTSTGRAIMQGDGHFVVYDASGAAPFATATTGNVGASLLIQDDGNLVLYRPDGVPIWDRFR